MIPSLPPQTAAIIATLNPNDFGDLDMPGRWWLLESGGKAPAQLSQLYLRFGHATLYGLKRMYTDREGEE